MKNESLNTADYWEIIVKIKAILAVSIVVIVIGAGIWYIARNFQYWTIEEVPGMRVQISQEREYNAFPKVTRTQDDTVSASGAIFAVWYSGNKHVDTNNDGRIMGAFSTDEGVSWSMPATVFDHPKYDCRNIGLICAPNGTLIIIFALVDGYAGENRKHIWVDFGFIKSYDHGKTWSEFTSFLQQPDFINLGMATGNGYGDPVIIGNTIYVLSYGYPQEQFEETHMAFLMTSSNNGESWVFNSTICMGSGLSIGESDFAFDSGVFFGFTRTQNMDKRYLHYIESVDSGKTWIKPQSMNILGDCPDILQLKRGDYIVAIRAYTFNYNYIGYFVVPKDWVTRTDKAEFIQSIELKCLVKLNNNQPSGDGDRKSVV